MEEEFVDIPILGTVGDNGRVDFYFDDIDERMAHEVERCHEVCKARGYPLPEVYDSEYGYKRSHCPICGKDTLVRGYIFHYRLVHTAAGKRQKKNMRKLPRYEPAAPAPEPEYMKVPAFDPVAWRQRSKESIERILKRHNTKI